jgi:threonine dehydratase
MSVTAGVTAADIAAARPAVMEIARRTPVLSSRTFSERAGGRVVLKGENLQRTGSFKVRGAAAKLQALGASCARGVVCASAGNHGQGVAAAAAARGVACHVFMPEVAPIAKVEAIAGQGATVHRAPGLIEECLAAAHELAAAEDLAFVHPFDDEHVIAGQGSVGLELLEQIDDLATIVVPVGGGGLASGIAIAVRSARPEVRVVGVQVVDSSLTIADGIAVKHPGAITKPLLDEWLDELVVVGEDDIAEAMFLCLERAKLVVEGAGAAGVAALLGGQAKPAEEGTTVAILSGGNVDASLLAAVARRHETEAGRRLVVFTKVPDRPGALVALLEHVAGTAANIVDVSHVREGVGLHVLETGVELVLETRGLEHAESVLRELADAGYEARVLR